MFVNLKISILLLISFSLAGCGGDDSASSSRLTKSERAAIVEEQGAINRLNLRLNRYWSAREVLVFSIQFGLEADAVEKARANFLKVESEEDIEFLLLHLNRRDDFLRSFNGKFTDIGSPEFDARLFSEK